MIDTPIISASELHQQLNHPDIIILDSSLTSNKAGMSSDLDGIRIKGARYFDIKQQFSDPKSPYPNMLPSPKRFNLGCKALGIQQTSFIIVYDKLGVYSSPRVWWMFKTMGHHNIAVLK